MPLPELPANSYDQVAIYQFPHEIFQSIFEILFDEGLRELDLTESGKRPVASSSISAVSQVSQRWRDISHSLSHIWTDVRILDFRDTRLDMVNKHISLSKGMPLSITIYYGGVVPQTQINTFWQTMLFVMSSSPRWSTLRISLSRDLFTARREAPLLGRLELMVLRVRKFSRGSYTLPRFPNQPILYLELTRTDSLKHLLLDGVRLSVPSLAYMERLEHLSLDRGAAEEMLDGRQVSAEDPPVTTRLRSLLLNGTVVLNFPQRSFVSEYTSTLTTLSLAGPIYAEPSHVTSMFDHLSTLSLQKISICDVDGIFWRAFEDSIMRQSVPRYPGLRTLHLERLSFNTSPKNVFAGLPNLEELALLFKGAQDLLEFLHEESVLPRLHTLSVRHIKYGALCDLVDARKDHGTPLITLEVDSPQFLDLSSLAYLRRKVANFKRTPFAPLELQEGPGHLPVPGLERFAALFH